MDVSSRVPCGDFAPGVDEGFNANGEKPMATVSKSQAGAQRSDTRNDAAYRQASAAVPPDRVAARAYEIWVASGRPSGRDQDHWFQAERELRGAEGSRGGR
jgi:hypothetical protein